MIILTMKITANNSVGTVGTKKSYFHALSI